MTAKDDMDTITCTFIRTLKVNKSLCRRGQKLNPSTNLILKSQGNINK